MRSTEFFVSGPKVPDDLSGGGGGYILSAVEGYILSSPKDCRPLAKHP